VQVELVGHVHALEVVRREPLRRRPQVIDARLRRLHEDVAALGDAVREVGILLEGVTGQVLVEALVLEDLSPEGHEPAVEGLDPADVGRDGDRLGEEPGLHATARLGPPALHAEEPPPDDARAVRRRRP
jgi:hypothetical protein